MPRPLFRCGRCGRRSSSWNPAGICTRCQREARIERENNPPAESLHDFRRRLKGSGN